MLHILLCQGYHKKAVSTYLHCYSVEVLYNYIFYSLESVHAKEYSQIYWYACQMMMYVLASFLVVFFSFFKKLPIVVRDLRLSVGDPCLSVVSRNHLFLW